MWVELLLFGSTVYLIFKYFNSNQEFWQKYGVQQIKNSTFLESIKVTVGMKPLSDFDDVAYQKMEKSGNKFVGVIEMGQPILIVKDLEIVKKIMIKDFDHFVDRRPFITSSSQEIVNKMLGNLTGEEWKGVRSQLSPTFTTGKIRRMMEFFNGISIEWVEQLKENIAKSGSGEWVMPVHNETRSYTTDVLASAVYGMKAGMVRNSDSYFSKMVKRLSDFTVLDIVKVMLSNKFPKLWGLLRLPIFDQTSLDFFTSLFSEGMKARMEGKVKLNDFIQILAEARKGELKPSGLDELNDFEKEAQLKNAHGKKNYLKDDLIVNAQAAGFFFAGFSTVSNYIGFVLYMLAINPDVQDKLRLEINSKLFNKGNGKDVDYDELNALPYLDMVICEVLRKFPPLDRLERKCVRDYSDPAENLKIPKDAVVGIPLRSIHNDRKYYEYPDKFYPEHFSAENKAKRSLYSFLVFGSGPRSCIGMRFALVESKAAVAHLVHNFIIEPTDKTPNPVKVKIFGPGVLVPDNLEVKLRLSR